MTDELAAMKRDAERYRWLRMNANESALYEHCGYEGSYAESMLSGARLDETIDAAIAANTIIYNPYNVGYKSKEGSKL